MASAFLGVACAAVAAPLNPAYKADEFRFYMDDLKVRLLILEEGDATPARAVAGELGIPVLDLRRQESRLARLNWRATGQSISAFRASPRLADDVALVLHTSGTTSRPKIVPLTHANLAASARNIVTHAEPQAEDRCLNIMPLFHIHGLVAGVLVEPCGARLGLLRARLQRAQILRLDRGGEAELVHGGSHHASGDPRTQPAQSGDHREKPPALRALELGLASGSGSARA